jgi:hypothetical protein
MAISCTWNRGLLVANRSESRWVQLTLGKGGNHRRVIWWPSYGQLALRVWRYWWLSLMWRSK